MSIQPTDSSNQLPDNLSRRVSPYSMAAAAAGVSVLALAAPAQSEVVITKKTITFTALGPAATVDLNNDGIPDFEFDATSFAYHGASNGSLFTRPLAGGAVVGKPLVSGGRSYASALMRGARIAASEHFTTGSFTIIEGTRGSFSYSGTGKHSSFGRWPLGTKNRYLGVKFLINGHTHYGWIRLSVNPDRREGEVSGTITAYAYETVPNKPIFAGVAANTKSGAPRTNADLISQPSLGMLATGAEGISLWRRE